ncbi:hypothetical protein ACTMTI_44210 [Nonomuraea sp. H19]|uniref:hypothetical protein n=1 Tax=Nonomuraea sp. H19 TaxID=3452206 RepID=UPI003F88CDD0
MAAPPRHLAVAQPPRNLLTDPAGLFAELARLSLPRGHYVVCGSAALYVRGLRARMGDLDVLARGAAWDVVLSLGIAPTAAPSHHGQVIHHPTLAIEFVDRWTPGWPTDDLIDSADLIDGFPVMRLGDVLAWKEHAHRLKDQPDITAIHKLQRLWTAVPALAGAVERAARPVTPRQPPAPPRSFTGRARPLAAFSEALHAPSDPRGTAAISAISGYRAALVELLADPGQFALEIDHAEGLIGQIEDVLDAAGWDITRRITGGLCMSDIPGKNSPDALRTRRGSCRSRCSSCSPRTREP